MPAPWLKPAETPDVREMGSDTPGSWAGGEHPIGSPCQPQINPWSSPRCCVIPRDAQPCCSPLQIPAGSVPPPLAGPAGTQTAPGSPADLLPGAAGLPAHVPTCGERCPSEVLVASAPPQGQHPPPHPAWGPEKRHLPPGLTSPPPSPLSSASSLLPRAQWATRLLLPPAVPAA